MKKSLKMFILAILVVLISLVIIFCYFFIGKVKTNKNITWGVDFSQMQAEALRLDWKKVYTALLDDLKVKDIKLHTQWDFIDGEKNKYFFDDVDWQISQAKKRGVKIIYVVGIKTGRWPECHIPKWAENLDEKKQQEEALTYLKEVINRYKDNDTISFWQVENEPFFKFGECPSWYYKNSNFLKKEIEAVRSIDNKKPIIVSDSGDLSFWLGAAKLGDVVGITMYRQIWINIANKIGFPVNYFFTPMTYWRRIQIIDKLFGKKVICIELQTEPWLSKPFFGSSVEEQLESMDLEQFKKNINFASKTGIDKFYLWGAEWWYWMKTTQNRPEIWNEAKKLFK